MLKMSLAFAVVALFWAIGDIVSIKTKSYVSIIFTGLTLFLIGFWTGLIPKEIINTAGLSQVGMLGVALLITHMGTLLSWKELLEQWKTVVIALVGLLGLVLGLIFLGPLLMSRTMAISSIGPISGGLVATLIMGQKCTAMGLPEISAFVVLLCAFQGFVGIPITSWCLNREAKRILKNPDSVGKSSVNNQTISISENKKETTEKVFKFSFPEKYQTTYILLFKLGFVALLAMWVGSYTGKYYLHPYIVCLLFGIIGTHFGLLDKDILTKANSFGFLMIALMGLLPGMIKDASPQVVIGLIGPLLLSLLLGAIFISIFSAIISGLLGYSKELGIAIGLSAMYGFPTSYILCQEVSSARGKNPEEKAAILDYLLPKILTAGFVTVTISSVFIAGIVVNFLH